MNIAIVAPSHVPFALGGAERLWTNLCHAINSSSNFQADIIKLPAPENDFWSIVDSYRQFYYLDLSHFDLVISGKNPTWMVNHPNHVIYMLHPLRGLYDTYSLFHLPYEVISNNPKIAKIAFACDKGVNTEELFLLLDDLRKDDLSLDSEQFRLPSPFLRKIVHRFDSNAMQGVKKITAISKTVASRFEYFHGVPDVEVIYPPSDLICNSRPAERYFFAYSRLDSAKRVDLIIKAFRKLEVDYELRIAGVGDQLAYLQELSKGDKRIKFLGRLSEEQLSQQLASAYAVPFIPYQEDYGLVAIEALGAGKPLITCTDSGGPTEFVLNGQNGFIAEPNTESLADAMNSCILFDNYSTLSKCATESVSNINWSNVIHRLIGVGFQVNSAKQLRRRILSLSTYPIYPPKGGGQARVFYLCKELSKQFHVHVICLVDGAESHALHKINDSFFVEYVPADKTYSEVDWELYQRSGIPTTDVTMVNSYKEAPTFVAAVRSAIVNSDIIIAEQPYVYALLMQYATNQLRIYNSQNVELLLKQQMFRQSPLKNMIADRVERVERMACVDADLIVYCSEADKLNMELTYSGISEKQYVIVENGAASETISYFSSNERRDIKARVLPNKTIGLFIASWHEPNIEAVRDLSVIASQTPDIQYLVVGSVGAFFSQSRETLAENILFTGLVSDAEKDMILQLSDFAINPMSSGSGTNIKMFDYMAAGLPLISTEVGARGIDLPKEFATIVPLDKFPEVISSIRETPKNIQKRIFVQHRYDWRAVSTRYINALSSLKLRH